MSTDRKHKVWAREWKSRVWQFRHSTVNIWFIKIQFVANKHTCIDVYNVIILHLGVGIYIEQECIGTLYRLGTYCLYL